MKRISWVLAAVMAVGVLSVDAMAQKKKGDQELEMVKKLERVMSNGRTVVTKWQGTINDASKGDKGFTPEVFEAEVLASLKENDKIDAAKMKGKKDPTSKAIWNLIESMKTVVAEGQPIINKQGMGFKGFLPAVFARKSFESFNEKSNIKGKLTAQIFRNAKNAPDEWEKEAIKKFVDRAKDAPDREQPIYKVVSGENGRVLRYIKPEFYKGKCLDCHGSPKGERDISGGIKEGFEEGAAGAALSFIVPMK